MTENFHLVTLVKKFSILPIAKSFTKAWNVFKISGIHEIFWLKSLEVSVLSLLHC